MKEFEQLKYRWEDIEHIKPITSIAFDRNRMIMGYSTSYNHNKGSYAVESTNASQEGANTGEILLVDEAHCYHMHESNICR